MDSSMAIIVGLFGLMIGSFLNVLIGRYTELETVVATRSRCPVCKKQIAWYDLIPLFSFILLRARCRNCRQPISWQYPVVEVLTALLALHLWSLFDLSWLALGYFVVFALLLVIAAIDARDYVVPDEFMIPALLVAFVLSTTMMTQLATPVLGAILPFWGVALAGGGLACLVLLSRGRWMGAGDIGLGVILGLLAGFWGSVVGLIIAFISGSLVGLLALLVRRKQLKDMVPFGPYLLVGTYIATIWGQNLAQWYLELIRFY